MDTFSRSLTRVKSIQGLYCFHWKVYGCQRNRFINPRPPSLYPGCNKLLWFLSQSVRQAAQRSQVDCEGESVGGRGEGSFVESGDLELHTWQIVIPGEVDGTARTAGGDGCGWRSVEMRDSASCFAAFFELAEQQGETFVVGIVRALVVRAQGEESAGPHIKRQAEKSVALAQPASTLSSFACEEVGPLAFG